MSLYDDYIADIQFAIDFPYGVPCDYWTTRDGTRIKLCDMSEDHIRNCMRIVGEDDAWYDKFEEELCRRCLEETNMDDDFDYSADMDRLYPNTEYVINKSAYDSGIEGVKEEIIRCKDCADCTEEGIYTPQYYCNSRHWNSGCCSTPTEPDGFCKWGKRKKLIRVYGKM